MQIVIDKDKEIQKIKDMLSNLTDKKDIQSVKFAINVIEGIDGIPLPKGHGRLIDADELKKDDEVTEWVSRDALRTGKNLKMFSELFLKKIDDAPTVIEAEGEEE